MVIEVRIVAIVDIDRGYKRPFWGAENILDFDEG